jgi:hypothetical protein
MGCNVRYSAHRHTWINCFSLMVLTSYSLRELTGKVKIVKSLLLAELTDVQNVMFLALDVTTEENGSHLSQANTEDTTCENYFRSEAA